MSIVSGEIRRPDEHGINTLHRADRIDVLDRLGTLDLHADHDIVVADLMVVLHCPVTVAAHRHRHTAHAGRRVARRSHSPARLLGAFHTGDKEVVETGVEQALDDHSVVPLRTHEGRTAAVLERHQLQYEGADVVRRMLTVEEQPVEVCEAKDFGGDGIRKRYPAPEELLPGSEFTLEGVWKRGKGRFIHEISRSERGRTLVVERLVGEQKLHTSNNSHPNSGSRLSCQRAYR